MHILNGCYKHSSARRQWLYAHCIPKTWSIFGANKNKLWIECCWVLSNRPQNKNVCKKAETFKKLFKNKKSTHKQTNKILMEENQQLAFLFYHCIYYFLRTFDYCVHKYLHRVAHFKRFNISDYLKHIGAHRSFSPFLIQLTYYLSQNNELSWGDP